MDDDTLPELLLDEPQLMGVESIERETVNIRMVARTLPGKQFEVGRRLRSLVVSGLAARRHRDVRRTVSQRRRRRC